MNSNEIIFLSIVINAVFLVVGSIVLYLFYARLRDIGDELRKIRVTYEMEQDRNILRAAKSPNTASGDKPGAGDAPYMPKA